MASPTLTSEQLESEFESIVGSQSDKWRHCEGQPESTLLRLAILREIVRALHAQKSKCLASGKRDLAQRLKAWETRLHDLRAHPKLEGDLAELVMGNSPLRKRTRLLPEALYSSLGRDKIERYDRQWEAALAAEACSTGWRFWALEAWVEITLAEEWNLKLNEQLWPSGVVLFAESSNAQSRDPSVSSHLWRGRWVVVANPRFKSPSEITAHLENWPGSPPEPPSPAQWNLLFSPK